MLAQDSRICRSPAGGGEAGFSAERFVELLEIGEANVAGDGGGGAVGLTEQVFGSVDALLAEEPGDGLVEVGAELSGEVVV